MEGYPERYWERHFGTGTVGKAWWGWPVEEGMKKVAHWGRHGEGGSSGSSWWGMIHWGIRGGGRSIGEGMVRVVHWGRHGES